MNATSVPFASFFAAWDTSGDHMPAQTTSRTLYRGADEPDEVFVRRVISSRTWCVGDTVEFGAGNARLSHARIAFCVDAEDGRTVAAPGSMAWAVHRLLRFGRGTASFTFQATGFVHTALTLLAELGARQEWDAFITHLWGDYKRIIRPAYDPKVWHLEVQDRIDERSKKRTAALVFTLP